MMPGHTEMMIVVKNLNDLQIDRLRKNIVQVFKNFWFLKSKSKRNQLNLTFLMSLLAWSKGHFDSTKSQIIVSVTQIKCLSNSINDLLPRNLSIDKIFDNTKEDYQKELDKSGYKTKFLYK